jgi:pectinesterase inhibitor-like protein
MRWPYNNFFLCNITRREKGDQSIKKRMVFPFGSSFLASLLLMFLFVTFSYGMPSTKIDNICSRTQNHSFCLDVLRSTHRKPDLDLRGLAQITLDLASSNATKTINLLHSLIKQTKSPQLRECYTSCSQNYDTLIGDLDQAKIYLSSRDHSGVNVITAGVLAEISDCKERFAEPLVDPSTLPKRNRDLENICTIILVISNVLSQ